MNDLYFLRYSLLGLCRASLLCGAVLFLSPQAKAQFNVYHPFPDSNAVWGMESGCLDNQCGDAAYIQNYYAGDTLMDAYVYKRVQEIYVLTSNNGCCYPPTDLGSFYMREDTANRIVYCREENMDEDIVLYDFSLLVGDTLTGYMGTCDMTWTVQSIDSILIGAYYRRKLNFTNIDSSAMFSTIEGIGSTLGLTTCPFIPFEMGITLSCFTVADSLLYPTSSGVDISACGDIASIVPDKIAELGTRVQISPNPTSGKLNVDCRAAQLPLLISICDRTGKLLIQKHISQAQSTIDISSLANGPYIVLVKQEGGLVSYNKIIKQ